MFGKKLFLCKSFEVLYLDSDADGVGCRLPRCCAMLQTAIASISMTGFECFCPTV